MKVLTSPADQVYKLQINNVAPLTIQIVDVNGVNVRPAQDSDIHAGSNTLIFKVPANAVYYVKFTGVAGSFNYGLQYYRNFPFYQGRQ